MDLNSGNLNRRIQIQRFVETGRDDFNNPEGRWQDVGPMIFARRRDVSDAERLRAAHWDNVLVTRFIIRATAFGRSIARNDRIQHEGITFVIDGIKEIPDIRGFLEITAKSGDVP